MKSYRWKQNLNWLFDNLLKYICLSQDNVDWGEVAYRRESVGDRLVAVSGWYIYDISKGRWLFGDCSAAARRVVSDKLETENNHREWSDMSHQPVADLSSTSPRPSCDPPPPQKKKKKKKKKTTCDQIGRRTVAHEARKSPYEWIVHGTFPRSSPFFARRSQTGRKLCVTRAWKGIDILRMLGNHMASQGGHNELNYCVPNKARPREWFNIKMLSYQYRKSHRGDKTILRPSYLHNGISYTGKMTSLY